MALRTISGSVTHVEKGIGSKIHASSGTHQSTAATEIIQELSFRIANTPVYYRLRVLPSMNDGDFVAASGKDKDGTLHAYAVRNLSTGAVYAQPYKLFLAGGLSVTVLSFPLMLLLVGFLFLPMGLWATWTGWKYRSAAMNVRNVQMPAPTAATPAHPAAVPAEADQRGRES